MRTFRIAMVQMNPMVGDLNGNARRITAWLREAKQAKADLVAFPELAITGYPPEDLLLKPQFLEDNRCALDEVIRACDGLVAVVGYVGQGDHADHRTTRQPVVSAGRNELYNSAAMIANRRLIGNYSKWYLPNYGVFDESRYFHPGRRLPLLTVNGTTIGVNICEDIWLPDVCRHLADFGAELLIVVNGSPYEIDKDTLRIDGVAKLRAVDTKLPLAYVNRVGGQDELVFDGASFVINGDGTLAVQMTDWEDAPALADKSLSRRIGGRTYDLYYDGSKLHMVVLRTPKARYWVVNTLLDRLSNETMIAIAKGLRPLGKAR